MISVVLVRPETAGNIGAVARSMANFGFSKLILVDPKCKHTSKEALDRAKHSKDILKKAKLVDSLEGFDYIVGTTSQIGSDYNIPRSPVSPEDLSILLKKKKGKIALVFGPEGKGLNNKEVQELDFVVTIPCTKKYHAMNLSHSVSIILYELFKSQKNKSTTGHINPISAKEKEQLMKIIKGVLSDMEFSTASKKKTQEIVWKRIIGKSFLTKREAYALMGFFKKI